MNLKSYYLLEVEEIIKESDTAFLLRFSDGEQAWVLKTEVVSPIDYRVGDCDVTIHLKED